MHASHEQITTPIGAIEPAQALQIIGSVLASEGSCKLERVSYSDNPPWQGVTSGVLESLELDADILATRLEGGAIQRYVITSAVRRAYPGFQQVGIHSLRPEVEGPGTIQLYESEINGYIGYFHHSEEGAELWTAGMLDSVLTRVAESIAGTAGNR